MSRMCQNQSLRPAIFTGKQATCPLCTALRPIASPTSVAMSASSRLILAGGFRVFHGEGERR